MRKWLPGALAFWVIVAALVPAGAGATTASYDANTGLRVQAAAGEKNRISVSRASNSFVFLVFDSDPSVPPVTPGPGCSRLQAREAQCSGSLSQAVTVDAGDGDDHVSLGNCGRSNVNLGDGFVSGGPGNDVIRGGRGRDALDGNDGNDVIQGCEDNDRLNGGAGNDTFKVLVHGSDTVIGGTGTDLLELNLVDLPDDLLPGIPASAVFRVSLDDQANDGREGTGEADNIGSDVENVNGTSLRDVIIGSSRANRLDGRLGNDTLSGGSPPAPSSSPFAAPPTPIVFAPPPGDDTLIGDQGDDELSGNGGDDRLDGGFDEDSLSGGAGNDTLLARDTLEDTLLACGTGNDSIDVDLRDLPVPPFPPDPPAGCEHVDQGAGPEKANIVMAQGTVRVRRGAAAYRLRCSRRSDRPCRGRLTAHAGSRRAGATRYALRRGRTRSVRLRLPGLRRARTLRLTSVEQGRHGPKVTIRTVRVRR